MFPSHKLTSSAWIISAGILSTPDGVHLSSFSIAISTSEVLC
jgi:hypothetical protein